MLFGKVRAIKDHIDELRSDQKSALDDYRILLDREECSEKPNAGVMESYRRRINKLEGYIKALDDMSFMMSLM